MTDEPYKPLSTFRGVSIKALFETFLTNGHTPFDAWVMLNRALGAADTVVTPPLASPWQTMLTAGNTIEVLTADGPRDPAQVLLAGRDFFGGDRPVPPMMPTAATRDPNRKPAMGPPVGSPEWLAAAWLAMKLEADSTIGRDDVKLECMDMFGISENLYLGYVWREAGKRVALMRQGSSAPEQVVEMLDAPAAGAEPDREPADAGQNAAGNSGDCEPPDEGPSAEALAEMKAFVDKFDKLRADRFLKYEPALESLHGELGCASAGALKRKLSRYRAASRTNVPCP